MRQDPEEWAEEQVEMLKGFSFQKLLTLVEKGNNKLHEVELRRRLENKIEKVEKLGKESDQLIEELEKTEENLSEHDVEEVEDKVDEMSRLNEQILSASKLLEEESEDG